MIRKILVILVLTTFFGSFAEFAFARGGGGGGRSSGGGFGGGGRSFSSSSRPSAPSRPTAPSRSFSSPSTSNPSAPAQNQSGGSWWGGKKSSPAPATTYNKDAASAMSREQSKEKFAASQQQKQSASSQTTASGFSSSKKSSTDYFKSSDSTASKQRVSDLKRKLNPKRMQDRDSRAQQRFGNYYSSPAPMMYHDSFNPWFWMWLMSQNNNTRAETIYHHKDEIDPERYKALVAKDAALEAKVKELEARGVKKDSTFTPAELGDDKDLMYSDEAVKAAHEEENSSGFPWFWTFVGVLAVGGLFVFALKARVFS